MKPAFPSRESCLGASVLSFLAAIALALCPAPGAAASSVGGQAPLAVLNEASAEISFPVPTPHAVLLTQPGGSRTLCSVGEVLPHPRNPMQSWRVERILGKALVLKETATGRRVTVAEGGSIPGIPDLVFVGTFALSQLRYRFKAVERPPREQPVLLSLEGTTAVLEVEVPRPAAPRAESPPTDEPPRRAAEPQRARLDAGLLSQVGIREVAADVYEVKSADVQEVLEHAGQVLKELSPMVRPLLSRQAGLHYQIRSAATDGVMSRRGFTVTAVKLARRAGLELGDTILSVNGRPVDGLGSLYAIYRQLSGQSSIRTIQVELERQGSRVTKTYQIR